MTEPKKLTPERLDAIRNDPFVRGTLGAAIDLLAHIAALEADIKTQTIQIGEYAERLGQDIATLKADLGAAIARANAADDELRDLGKLYDTQNIEMLIMRERAEAAEARVKALEAERDEWRKRCVDAEVHRARAGLSPAKEDGND